MFYYVNKFSTTEYFDHYRVLYNEVNIISLPYKTIGYKIKPQSFLLTTGSVTIKDDGKGHLYDGSYTINDTNFKNSTFDATILLCEVDNPSRFGIADVENQKILKITEKPKNPISNLADTGI